MEDSSEKASDIQRELVRVVNTILEKKDALQGTVKNDSDKNIRKVSVNAMKSELKIITKILGNKIGRELPLDADVNKVMRIISRSSDVVITPSIDYKKNKISYYDFESLGNTDDVIRILDKMTLPPFNFLDKEISEKFPICPLHPEFLGVTLRRYCPKCSSLNTVPLHIFEHMVCGNIIENNLPDIPSGVNCPYCKKNIIESELRKKGRWHVCSICASRFDNHEIKLHCIEFDHDVEIEKAKMVVVPRYKITIDSRLLSDYAITLLRHLNDLLEPNSTRQTA